MIKHYEPAIPDRRHASYVRHSVDQMLTLRILLLACGYEDCNDIQHLSSDPALQSLPGEFLSAQNTLSRWENSLSKTDVARLASCMVDAYVDSISPDREHIIIDVDCTDDPTHGKQQGSLFHGYYWHYMYNQLFYLDGQAGQVILPVLRPGNVHSGKWNDRFLKLIIHKIRQKHPHVQIHLRADAGFSCPEFYECAETLDFGFCIGIASNQTLKRLIEDEVGCVEEQYVGSPQKLVAWILTNDS